MIELVHSDNTCAVGWTSIWARMNYLDMLWLLKKEPNGYFTPTFVSRGKNNCDYLNLMKNLTPYNQLNHRGFYFTFPINPALLLILKLKKGMKDVEHN